MTESGMRMSHNIEDIRAAGEAAYAFAQVAVPLLIAVGNFAAWRRWGLKIGLTAYAWAALLLVGWGF